MLLVTAAILGDANDVRPEASTELEAHHQGLQSSHRDWSLVQSRPRLVVMPVLPAPGTPRKEGQKFRLKSSKLYYRAEFQASLSYMRQVSLPKNK